MKCCGTRERERERDTCWFVCFGGKLWNKVQVMALYITIIRMKASHVRLEVARGSMGEELT